MSNRHLDLRTGRTVWQQRRLPRLDAGPLRRDHRCDVLVVGSGISGAFIAESLSDAGLAVTVVDRRSPVSGSTPASTALLQHEIDIPLHVLSRRWSRSCAERIWLRSRLCVDAIRERSRRLGIDADLVNRDSLYLEGSALDRDGLLEEQQARARIGLESTWLSRTEVRQRWGFGGRAALRSYDNLAADPRRLAAGYLKVAKRRGTRLFFPVEIVKVESTRASIHAFTATGVEIRARHLIFATGYEIPDGVPHKGLQVASTYVIATRPQRRVPWLDECLIWEAADPYIYLRTTPDRRVICGGEDEDFTDETTRDALLTSKARKLRRRLAVLFPQLDHTIDFAWCGSFGTSASGTPRIGPVPRMPNCYAALGYGGNGTTYSMMAAQMLRNMICGNGDADADLVRL